MPKDVRESLDAEADGVEHAEEDEDILLADYQSDDEKPTEEKEEKEKDKDHITKVNIGWIRIYCIM